MFKNKTRDFCIKLYHRLVLKILKLMNPEKAHHFVIWILKLKKIKSFDFIFKEQSILQSRLWNYTFKTPLGLAAGFDKNAEIPNQMLSYGFSFVEIGSVTPLPQLGNPKPRLFRLSADRAIINRMGFNNDGAYCIAQRLQKRSKIGFIGVNLGKNKDSENPIDDYIEGIKILGPYTNYLVINVSSPNTIGLRSLQKASILKELLLKVIKTRNQYAENIPILLKVAPDLTQKDKYDIATIVLNLSIDGMIISNTTISRSITLKSKKKYEQGGLSGAPLMESSTKILGDFYRLTQGKIPLIGVGGIQTGYDAYQKILHGASLIQIYSSLIYDGIDIIRNINLELISCLKKDGFKNISDAIGANIADVKNNSLIQLDE